MDLVTPKAAAKHELLFNKPVSVLIRKWTCYKRPHNPRHSDIQHNDTQH
jgi:hypothetical protein